MKQFWNRARTYLVPHALILYTWSVFFVLYADAFTWQAKLEAAQTAAFFGVLLLLIYLAAIPVTMLAVIAFSKLLDIVAGKSVQRTRGQKQQQRSKNQTSKNRIKPTHATPQARGANRGRPNRPQGPRPDMRGGTGRRTIDAKMSDYEIDEVDEGQRPFEVAPTAPLARMIEFPGLSDYDVLIGRNERGMVRESWERLGHILICGMTGYGKSVFLRLLVHQAVAHGHSLLFLDMDGTTFKPFQASPLCHISGDIHSAEEVATTALEMMEERRKLLERDHKAESIAQLQKITGKEYAPIYLFIDEYNGLVTNNGGPNGEFAKAINQIAWRGRKFGVHLVLAGQVFEKAVIGHVRNQLTTRVCYRVASPSESRIVLGGGLDATGLDIPGRALSNVWGEIQTFYISAEQVRINKMGISKQLYDIVVGIYRHNEGSVTYRYLQNVFSLTRSQAKNIRATLLNSGMANHAPDQTNRVVLNLENKIIRRVAESNSFESFE